MASSPRRYPVKPNKRVARAGRRFRLKTSEDFALDPRFNLPKRRR